MSDLIKKLRAVDHMSVEDCFLQSHLFAEAADALSEIAEAERRGALAERGKLTPIILEMASEIEATIQAAYPPDLRKRYPDQKRRYERDMELPREARALAREG